MHVFVEGPKWAGMWSEIVVDALQQLGHTTCLFYHNSKSGSILLRAAFNRFVPATRSLFRWEDAQQEKMFEAVCASECDLLFSIQGKIDSSLISRLNERRPDLKIVYWLGDVLVEPTRRRLDTLRAVCESGDLDSLLVSYRGTYDQLCREGYKNVKYFPFGASEKYHSLGTILDDEKVAFASKVSFVGSCYPERAEVIRYLNAHLDEPVRVWGRGWRKEGIHSEGSLDLADSLKVHACSKVSLNIHHHLTDNGFNMKFYEIPAVGGFQLCDWQQEIEVSPFQGVMQSFKDKEQLLELIRFYLSHEAERSSLTDKANQIAWDKCNYSTQISELIQSLKE